jgi:hypothetical protein
MDDENLLPTHICCTNVALRKVELPSYSFINDTISLVACQNISLTAFRWTFVWSHCKLQHGALVTLHLMWILIFWFGVTLVAELYVLSHVENIVVSRES